MAPAALSAHLPKGPTAARLAVIEWVPRMKRSLNLLGYGAIFFGRALWSIRPLFAAGLALFPL